jgi:hypothetical protein
VVRSRLGIEACLPPAGSRQESQKTEGVQASSVRSVNVILNGERANANAFLLENNDGSLFKIVLNPF